MVKKSITNIIGLATIVMVISPLVLFAQSTTLHVGDRITANATVTIRLAPSATSTALGVAYARKNGTVTSGPVSADSHLWWKIDYDYGFDGWSIGDDLVTTTTPAPDAISVGGRVVTTGLYVNTRATPAYGTLLGTHGMGVNATVISGPTIIANGTWYQLDYDFGPDGWSDASYLNPTTLGVPTPLGIGKRITVFTNAHAINVYDTPSLSGNVLGTVVRNTPGTIAGGPIVASTTVNTANGFSWWQVNFDGGPINGWVAENLLLVVPPPTVTLTATPSTVNVSASSTLAWTSMYANSCTASGGWTGTVATSGMQIIGGITQTASYILSCSGIGGSTSQSAVIVVADTTPPSVPSSLTATSTSQTQINLTWQTSTDNVGVTGYKIFRNTIPIGTSTALSFSDAGLTAATTYSYTVSAYDAAGNVSDISAVVSATTLGSAKIGTGAIIHLSTSWKFATDPSDVGEGQQWYGDSFDDSAWRTLLSGKSWESQGVAYAGYAWYRQQLVIPAASIGVPLKITLASTTADDDVYFNGVRIGGLKGGYMYNNLVLRTYYVPASLVHYGAVNTLATRIWGGKISGSANSGLIAGIYTVTIDPYGLSARDVGAPISAEQPVQLYDLSAAQQGKPFELVFRFSSSTIPTGGTANLTYTITDFYGGSIKTGTVPLSLGSDTVARGVVSIDTVTAQKIYVHGRFKAALVVKNGATSATISSTLVLADNLSFAHRDQTALSALPTTYEDTPYGSLKLVDTITASTPLTTEVHPYLQGGFSVHAGDYMTPGSTVNVMVNSILGKQVRESAYGWFAYRIGRGTLTPGKTYLVRIEYPEDKPRYAPIEIQNGQNYVDVGWKNGLSSTDVYDNWPLSNTYQYYDVIVPLGKETVGTGGTEDASTANGFWIYFMNKEKPGYYFSMYSGGPAVATIKLYEIDPIANAPQITLPPSALPQRVMDFDWERQATALPTDMVQYAKLMGYSAISPIMLKWATMNWADPVAGFDSANVDGTDHWVTRNYAIGSGNAPSAPVPGVSSVNAQYLSATKSLGIDYIPRVEYGGSHDLPVSARAIGANGITAKPNRFNTWGANLLNPATFTDFKAYLDSLIKPNVASNPQIKGVLWRIREDRMQISYGRSDVQMFATETGTPLPSGFATSTPAQIGAWASTGTIGAAYSTWWQGKRRDFDQQIANLLKSYGQDMTLYYFNWDEDKFSLMEPELNSADFYAKVASLGGPRAYADDRTARASYTVNDYINAFTTGHFTSWLPRVVRPDTNWADYALRPSLYANTSGIQLIAPVNELPYATSGYINYFQTKDGLAVSNAVPYDEIGARETNPKFEGNMVLPASGPFSMAMELLSYYYGDARTLTYTVYTYGRGFADAHRRFAQAFRALPAIPGTLVSGTPANVAARVYSTTALGNYGTYIGIAYKGYVPTTFTVSIPGTWNAQMVVTNLVTNQTVPTSIVGGNLQITIPAGPMELDAFHIQ